MGEDFLIVTTGVLQGVAKHRKPNRIERPLRQFPFLVSSFGQPPHGCVVPGEPIGFNHKPRPKGIAEKFANEGGLLNFGLSGDASSFGGLEAEDSLYPRRRNISAAQGLDLVGRPSNNRKPVRVYGLPGKSVFLSRDDWRQSSTDAFRKYPFLQMGYNDWADDRLRLVECIGSLVRRCVRHHRAPHGRGEEREP